MVMGQGAISLGPAFAVVLAALVALAALAALIGRLGVSRATVTASARAVLQLGAVSLLIAGSAALLVGDRRIHRADAARRGRHLGAPGQPLRLRLAGHRADRRRCAARRRRHRRGRDLPLTEVAVLPIAGILIGGAMTATSLAGRRALDELRDRHGEYEAALALGFLPRDAALEVCRPTVRARAAARAGPDPDGRPGHPARRVRRCAARRWSAVQAGATQLLVLVALLAVEAVAVGADRRARGLRGAAPARATGLTDISATPVSRLELGACAASGNPAVNRRTARRQENAVAASA